eukprot:CAMPEP_0174961104 /NCGR_PEP_ID=MMETSP0004_2-20121128/4060_1 /TAXON_ID=420556 /ORGANISM="Ochromonas sp., Strain CCMP1393" /LENGTH=495 /DNA_ID=CAMNT_0016209523 /DNA_START=258 /DNA_END=1745 /DNA_ORIENTATION=-
MMMNSILVLLQLISSSLTIVTYALPTDGLHYFETFDDGADIFVEGRWILSSQQNYKNQPVRIKAPTQIVPGLENDKGLQLTQEMKHYGVASKVDPPFHGHSGQDIIIQFEVKLEETLECGGAYIKLLRESGRDLNELDSDTPYSIMFGPDKCGDENKVHFIVQYQSPKTNEWTEQHYNQTISIKTDKKTHLYTLTIRNDSSFEIFIDMKAAGKGSLLSHLWPGINPPIEIDDRNDTKPSDWIDEPEIDDPDAVKPSDWDEAQPLKIPDESAMKPTEWQDHAPALIPDPDAIKPSEWDDEEDGDWEPPLIANPICETVGCGTWEKPTIRNPLYKGPWKAAQVPNPLYRGVWRPRKIPNPSYFEDSNPVLSLAPITAIAIEVWTTSAAILFDNFVLSHSSQAVHEFTVATFVKKAKAERRAEKKEELAAEKMAYNQGWERGSFMDVIGDQLTVAMQSVVQISPVIIGSVMAIMLGLVYIIVSNKIGGNRKTNDTSRS